MEQPSSINRREFARVDVRAEAQVMPVEPEELEALRVQLLRRASVWAPGDITALRMMANGSPSRESSMLARALVELSREVARLRQVSDGGDWDARGIRGALQRLSGNGGQLESPAPVQKDDLLLMRVIADDSGMPPVQCLIRVVDPHVEPGVCGFRFEAIHPEDQDRMVRHVFRVQRQELRDAAFENEDD